MPAAWISQKLQRSISHMSKQMKNCCMNSRRGTYRRSQDAFITLLTARDTGRSSDWWWKASVQHERKRQRTAYFNTLFCFCSITETIVWCWVSPESIADELDKPFEDLDRLIERVLISKWHWEIERLRAALEGVQKSRLLMDGWMRLWLYSRRSRKTENACIISFLHHLHSAGKAESSGITVPLEYVIAQLLPASVSRQSPFFPFVYKQHLRQMHLWAALPSWNKAVAFPCNDLLISWRSFSIL